MIPELQLGPQESPSVHLRAQPTERRGAARGSRPGCPAVPGRPEARRGEGAPGVTRDQRGSHAEQPEAALQRGERSIWEDRAVLEKHARGTLARFRQLS